MPVAGTAATSRRPRRRCARAATRAEPAVPVPVQHGDSGGQQTGVGVRQQRPDVPQAGQLDLGGLAGGDRRDRPDRLAVDHLARHRPVVDGAGISSSRRCPAAPHPVPAPARDPGPAGGPASPCRPRSRTGVRPDSSTVSTRALGHACSTPVGVAQVLRAVRRRPGEHRHGDREAVVPAGESGRGQWLRRAPVGAGHHCTPPIADSDDPMTSRSPTHHAGEGGRRQQRRRHPRDILESHRRQPGRMLAAPSPRQDPDPPGTTASRRSRPGWTATWPGCRARSCAPTPPPCPRAVSGTAGPVRTAPPAARPPSRRWWCRS